MILIIVVAILIAFGLMAIARMILPSTPLQWLLLLIAFACMYVYSVTH